MTVLIPNVTMVNCLLHGHNKLYSKGPANFDGLTAGCLVCVCVCAGTDYPITDPKLGGYCENHCTTGYITHVTASVRHISTLATALEESLTKLAHSVVSEDTRIIYHGSSN